MGKSVKLEGLNENRYRGSRTSLSLSLFVTLILTSLLFVGFVVFLLNLIPVSAEAGHSVIMSSTNGVVGPEATTDPTPDCGLAWRAVPVPNLSNIQNDLFGVDAISTNDAWAVGLHSSLTLGQSLALHWDGAQWNVTNSVNLGTYDDLLIDVEAVSSNDVWAVGYSKSDGPEQSLIEHWNGNTWSATLFPAPYGATLRRLSVVSSTDIWAVGYQNEPLGIAAASRILTMHWDGTSWQVVPGPSIANSIQDELWGISAISSDDIWAVGHFYDQLNNIHNLAIHWDGTQWSKIATPDPGHAPYLRGVAAIAADNVWAVGSTGDQTLVLHWDGYDWLQVDSPNAPVDNSFLQSIDVGNANNIWAAGYSCCPQRTLILHWDGTMWSITPSPNPGAYDDLLADISVTSDKDVWSVGEYRNCNGCPFLSLMARYSDPCLTPNPTVTGTPPTNTPIYTNTRMPTRTATSTHTPMPTAEECGVNSNFAVASATGVAFVQGTTDIGNHCLNCSTSVDLPFPVSLYDRVFTTANVSSNGIVQFGSSAWALDSCLPNAGIDYAVMPYWGPFRTDMGGAIYTRIDGQAPSRVYTIEWRVCRSTGPDSCGGYSNFEVRFHESTADQQFEFVYGAMDGGGMYGSVGVQKGQGQYITQYSCYTNTLTQGTQLTFTLQPCDTGTPSVTPTSSPTSTAIPTETVLVTASPETPTILPTSTVCMLTFSDVPPDSTFYAYIECMACRGIITGYADDTFRPGSNVTRGQLAKIVSNSAGFDETPGAQQFEDVSAGSTFFDYVWRLADRAYISGYECGGAGEPCGSGNLPYFRPSSSATRGQISKIVANAAGLSDPAGAQMFADVAPGSTYYNFIERLAAHGVMSGYACGGVGEPCRPGNLPYFRPAGIATRGQTSKIVANTFFPGCFIPNE